MVADRSERLPWLQEVPRMAPPAAPPPRRRKSRRLAAPLAGIALLLAGIGGGAYWAGTLDGPALVSGDPVYEPAPDPMSPVAPVPALPIPAVPVAEAPPAPVERAIVEPEPAAPIAKPVQVPAPVIVPDAPAPKLSSRVRERLKKVRAEAKKEETVQPVKVAARTVKLTPRTKPKPRPFQLVPPGPRGRIVQLGSFTAVPDAQQNWRGIAKRWPYLLTKSRILTPIWMPQEKGWRLIYRLQLGTASQAQSAVICQRLQKAGQPCVVVY